MVLEVLRALARRWYVVLLGVLLTLGAVYGAAQISPPDYHARGLVLVLPSDSGLDEGGNPFLRLDGLEQPAGILVAYFSGATAQEEVAELSPTAEFAVMIEGSTRGPIIAIEVTDVTEAKTLMILEHLVDRIPEELLRLQEQVAVPTGEIIGSMPLTVDQEAEVDRSGPIRLMILALVAGISATTLTAYYVDSRAQRQASRGPRRKRRGVTHYPPTTPEDATPSASPAEPSDPGWVEMAPPGPEHDPLGQRS